MIAISDVIESPPAATAEAARHAIRRGTANASTPEVAAACVQAHVVILPSSLAEDFHDFCLRNRQSCPLIAVSEPGQAMLPTLGDDIDVRCDVPGYQVWREGQLTDEATDIRSIWRRDLVTFVLAGACGFEQTTWRESASSQRPWPVYVTQVPTASVGPFGGPMWVGMRALRADRAIHAIGAAACHGQAHGIPVHVGDPALIGIRDLRKPQSGEGSRPATDEIAVFWASALTAQAAARRARPLLCITNAPGALLITDLLQPSVPESKPGSGSGAPAGSAAPHFGWR